MCIRDSGMGGHGSMGGRNMGNGDMNGNEMGGPGGDMQGGPQKMCIRDSI